MENLTAEELVAKKELTATLKKIGRNKHPEGHMEVARLANQPYDAELPVSEVIEAVFVVASVEPGEDYDYFVISPTTKTVYTVVDGSVTQANITADSHGSLSFSDYDSEESYIYLKALLEGKYDPIANRADDQQEVLNRLEVKAVTDLLIAGAESQSNTFSFTSGETKYTFEKIIAMVRSVAKYGTKLVLITGANVTTDIMLMDFDTDKQREATWSKAGISAHFPIEAFAFTHSGAKIVMDADKAIVVAVSDSKNQKPGHFVRRKLDSIEMGDEVVNKERLIISTGPAKHVGSNRKLAIGILTYELFGAVLTNEYTTAVFKRDAIYS